MSELCQKCRKLRYRTDPCLGTGTCPLKLRKGSTAGGSDVEPSRLSETGNPDRASVEDKLEIDIVASTEAGLRDGAVAPISSVEFGADRPKVGRPLKHGPKSKRADYMREFMRKKAAAAKAKGTNK